MNDGMPSIYTFSEDINNAEAPKPLPQGSYRAVIKSAAAHTPKSGSEKKSAKVQFFIDSAQYPADYTDGNPDGTLLDYYVSMEDNPMSRYILKSFCAAIGAPMSRSIDVSQWIGMEATVKVVHEEYEGVMRHKLDRKVQAA